MSAMPDVLRHMNGWGFTKVEPQPHAAWLVMVGELSTPTQGCVQCEVWIDRTFERPLKVWLNKLPESTPRLVPHLGPDGYLCYAAPGTQVIDIYDPVGQIRTSLLQATEVLEQALAGKMKDDLQEEFFVYWDGIYCFHDIERRTSGSVQLLQLSDNKMYVLTDDAARSRAKFARPGRKIEEFTSQVALITSSAAPRPLQENWPPKTVSQILDWQHELDDACRRKIRDKIIAAYRDEVPGLLIVIESQKTGYSYGFLVHDLQRNRPDDGRSGDQRIPIFDCPIDPVQMFRLDDKYLAERNIPGRTTLSGKRIGLIGCGTIGGFLGEMLVKAGAGTGGGELLLIDNDLMMPQNLGRHRLGFNYLFKSKAHGLADELLIVLPSIRVRGFNNDAKDVNLSGLDLIIDATGEEAFGHWLAKATSCPALHVWIEGAGVAVRSLIKHRTEQGCYRCLTEANSQGELLSVVGGVEPIFAGQGCEGLYVPFPASVSIQAAALALDTALAWVAGKPWPSLSTRLTDYSFEPATPDCSPLPHSGCPACRS
ncbi:ThiF family adenylyltransferase [Pseudomonas guariconensis]|uniref:ThiF family adenylyltransferase n=1 Tax=Pseudomonas guariconensis TaxID=1288410 RepID=UPI0018A9C51D|nr:ThiF family adenylyltransferase [Pseudomonas guariconensis]MBF8742091.1 ThiF family adenylyltransferase [Pseudomonas guariconensis]MBF8751087.1 ThiF family adenylyltransferase [Pseudomonas guariconensis]